MCVKRALGMGSAIRTMTTDALVLMDGWEILALIGNAPLRLRGLITQQPPMMHMVLQNVQQRASVIGLQENALAILVSQERHVSG